MNRYISKIPKTSVVDIIKNLFSKQERTISLGRWGAHNHSQKNLKVDYSNEDHCGVCSQYIESKHSKDNDIYHFDYLMMNSNNQS